MHAGKEIEFDGRTVNQLLKKINKKIADVKKSSN